MRIVASRVIRVGGKTAAPVGTARAPVDSREGLVLVLTADDGTEGLGEASPLPGYSPDTIDDAAAALDGIHHALAEPLPPALADPAPGSASLVDSLEAVTRSVPALAGSPSARFAVETALLDLLGRVHGLPVHRLLRASSPAPLKRAALLPPPCDPRTAPAAREATARGISTLKLKLGSAPFDRELAALVALRERIGDAVELRLDANGGFGRDAASRLRALAPVKPGFVEEPVSGTALLALLDESPAVPVAADESLADPILAEKLLAHPNLGAVVLKPALLGFVRALAIAARRTTPVVVTHLFDGPIALAACAELALSLPNSAACGLDPHPALAAFPVLPIPQLEDSSRVLPTGNVGLGIRPAREEGAAWR